MIAPTPSPLPPPGTVTPIMSPGDKWQMWNYLRLFLSFIVEGAAGIGKSLGVEWLVTRLEAGRGFGKVLKIDITEDTEVRHLVGEVDLVKYFAVAQRMGSSAAGMESFFKPGPLLIAALTGRTIIIEELDRAGRDTLFPVLFDAIEYKRVYVPDLGRMIYGIEGFNIVITVNRFTDSGTVTLPKALMRRPRCVRLYDPSKESGINAWQGVQFEAEIIMAGVRGFLVKKGLDPDRAKDFAEEILGQVIFPMRARHEFEDAPSPSETAMWFKDMCHLEGDQFLQPGVKAEASMLLEICLRCRGALVKSAADDASLVERLCRYFLEERLP